MSNSYVYFRCKLLNEKRFVSWARRRCVWFAVHQDKAAFKTKNESSVHALARLMCIRSVCAANYGYCCRFLRTPLTMQVGELGDSDAEGETSCDDAGYSAQLTPPGHVWSVSTQSSSEYSSSDCSEGEHCLHSMVWAGIQHLSLLQR